MSIFDQVRDSINGKTRASSSSSSSSGSSSSGVNGAREKDDESIFSSSYF